MISLSELIYMTEEGLLELLEQYRSLGPWIGILLTFLKSFIPPLPTIVIVGANALAFGLWPGFFYSWLGITSGCIVSFLIVRKLANHSWLQRMRRKSKVQKGMRWIQFNSFRYVLVLSVFPIGPFVIVNTVAGLARMPIRSYIIAILIGKALMVFMVSYFGHDLGRLIERPSLMVAAILMLVASIWFIKRIERFVIGSADQNQAQQESIS